MAQDNGSALDSSDHHGTRLAVDTSDHNGTMLAVDVSDHRGTRFAVDTSDCSGSSAVSVYIWIQLRKRFLVYICFNQFLWKWYRIAVLWTEVAWMQAFILYQQELHCATMMIRTKCWRQRETMKFLPIRNFMRNHTVHFGPTLSVEIIHADG